LLVLLASNDISLPLYHDLHTIEGGEMFAILSAPERLMREEEILDFRFHIDRIKAPSPGQRSLRALARALRGGSVPDDLGQHLGNILSDLDGVTNLVYQRVFNAGTDLVEPDDTQFSIGLDLVVEAAPDPDSRITLGEERDLFGQNRIEVDWRLSDLDLRTARRAIELAALEFGRLGFGRGRGDLLEDGTVWPADTMEAGKHHCGTARMSADPKAGVVDTDCRVHGMSNLYVAGSAVFPTIGYANPTLTIVALALRLADHLKDQMA
jgi:choline dehydrogenase-like flavoprotein